MLFGTCVSVPTERQWWGKERIMPKRKQEIRALNLPLKIASDNINDLTQLNNDALCSLWVTLFNNPPPARARKSLLIDCLAYRIQEQAHGGLALSTRTRLKKLASDVMEGKKPAVLFQTVIKPGTRLIRSWGGQTHEVYVVDDGFTYRDQRFTNLSEIARTITGSRWSGPRFFGLNKTAKEQSNKTTTVRVNNGVSV
jgi:hypothetical protein